MSATRTISLALAAIFAAAAQDAAAATWGVDLALSSLSIDGDTYADNGANGFRPGGVWDQDNPPIVAAFQPNFVVGPDTFDFGATVNPISSDRDLSIPFVTSASAVGVITIDGLGSSTLEIRWRANTLNDNFDGDGFLSDSSVLLLSQIVATIDGVGPGTPVEIIYDWDYFATAVPDHEALMEDPETANGSVGFLDDQGTGPGNLFGVIVGEPGVLTSMDSDNDSYSLTTSNPSSSLTINLDGGSITRMNSPGNGPFQEDLAGSEFIGRLTLTLRMVPEPASWGLAFVAVLGAGLMRVRPRPTSPQ